MYIVLPGSGPFDRKLRKTPEKSSRFHNFQHIMLVVRLFYVPGLFECAFREQVDCTRISKCHFERFEQKKVNKLVLK